MGKFAAKLKSIRKAKGLSQYALAKVSGITDQAISLLELDERQPSWDTVQRLAAALGVDCTVFAEDVTLPDAEPARPRGRPRATDPPAKPGRKPKKK